jgi:dihydrofolate reductase
MAQLIVSMNVSADGYISAQGDDDGAWLRIDEPVHTAFNALAAGAAAFLYGRKVYELMIPYWPEAAEGAATSAHEREYARHWMATPKVVFSTSLDESRWNTRVVHPGALDEVTRMKRESDRYLLCYGGSQFASALQQRGLVDEYALFVHPTSLGSGQPFFRDRLQLELLDVRRFENGVLAVRYSAPVAVA